MADLVGKRLARPLGWLDTVADAVQPRLRRALGAVPPLRNALDGTWLGTPLHPPLTDIPIGATTAALVLDSAESLAGSSRYGVAADYALAVGVFGTLPTAVAGTSDWRELRGETRRVATLHGLLNVTALALHGCSLIGRARGQRTAAKIASTAGFLTTALAGHIGGELSFAQGVGINRTAWQHGPRRFTPVLDEAEVGAGELKRVEVRGVPVVLSRSASGELQAIAATCSHMGGPLERGERDGDTVVCPWHGSRFDLGTGAVLSGPSAYPQPCFEARVRDGKIELRAG